MDASRRGVVVLALTAAGAAPGAALPATINRTSDAIPSPINVARGRPVAFDPAPDYRYCTDPDDAHQLTDGEYVSGCLWTQKGCVGWNRARPAIITIDLGRTEPLGGVSFSTAAGTAGVEWPQALYLLASDDGTTWSEIGELISMARIHGEPPASGYAVHRFRTDALRASGRHVAFVLSTAVYGFVDEIEIYRGGEGPLPSPPDGGRFRDLRAYYRERIVGQFAAARIASDARAVLALADAAGLPDDVRHRVRSEMMAAMSDAGSLRLAAWPAGFQAVLPIHELHRRVFRSQAAVWRASGRNAPIVRAAGPWDPLEVVHPIPLPGPNAIDMSLLRGERRAAALNISNPADDEIELVLSVEGLPGGANPAWIRVHEVAWTDTNQGVPVAAALPPAPRTANGYSLAIPSGMTRQVWLDIGSEDVPPGEHRGVIRFAGAAGLDDVPLRIRVSRLAFPDRPTLHLGGWDYTDADAWYEVTPANRDAVIAHLRERFVDSPWATSAVLARGIHSDDGGMTAPPDTSRFDAWVDRWPDARQYCVYAAAGARFDRFAPRTPAFAVAVGDWIRFWAHHAATRGVLPEQLMLLLVDEPSTPEQDALILAWAEAIRSAGTGVRLFEDPLHIDPAKEADPAMLAACDVLCLHRPRFLHRESYRRFYVERRPPGAELAFYSCNGPVRLLDPYAYHRLQAWSCWKYGATGSYFWAFGDSGGASSWNEYVSTRFPYVPFFIDPAGVTPGKHMEAIREGVQDYEYLVLLRKAIESAERGPSPPVVLARAKALLAGAPDRVLGTPTVESLSWAAVKDRSVADRIRAEILDALEALDGF